MSSPGGVTASTIADGILSVNFSDGSEMLVTIEAGALVDVPTKTVDVVAEDGCDLQITFTDNATLDVKLAKVNASVAVRSAPAPFNTLAKSIPLRVWM